MQPRSKPEARTPGRAEPKAAAPEPASKYAVTCYCFWALLLCLQAMDGIGGRAKSPNRFSLGVGAPFCFCKHSECFLASLPVDFCSFISDLSLQVKLLYLSLLQRSCFVMRPLAHVLVDLG